MLVLKVLGPVVVSAIAIFREWSEGRGRRQQRRVIWLTVFYIAAAVISVPVIVLDHRGQAAHIATLEDDARQQREATKRTEQALQRTETALQRAEEDAAQARRERQEIAGSVQQVASFMRERNPALTDQQALDGVIAEIRDLEDQLTGLRMYRDVAELDVMGDSRLIGGRVVTNDSPLVRALEGTWEARDGQYHLRCDQASLAKFSAVTKSHPTFPFAHSALATCGLNAGEGTWRQHAARAVEILRHTTQIAGHKPDHDTVYEGLLDLLKEPSP